MGFCTQNINFEFLTFQSLHQVVHARKKLWPLYPNHGIFSQKNINCMFDFGLAYNLWQGFSKSESWNRKLPQSALLYSLGESRVNDSKAIFDPRRSVCESLVKVKTYRPIAHKILSFLVTGVCTTCKASVRAGLKVIIHDWILQFKVSCDRSRLIQFQNRDSLYR